MLVSANFILEEAKRELSIYGLWISSLLSYLVYSTVPYLAVFTRLSGFLSFAGMIPCCCISLNENSI